jgi:hypothetical protein
MTNKGPIVKADFLLNVFRDKDGFRVHFGRLAMYLMFTLLIDDTIEKVLQTWRLFIFNHSTGNKNLRARTLHYETKFCYFINILDFIFKYIKRELGI